MSRKFSYSCVECGDQSTVDSVFNKLGLPTHCNECKAKNVKKKAKLYVEGYQKAKGRNLEEKERIIKTYKEACRLLGLDPLALENDWIAKQAEIKKAADLENIVLVKAAKEEEAARLIKEAQAQVLKDISAKAIKEYIEKNKQPNRSKR